MRFCVHGRRRPVPCHATKRHIEKNADEKSARLIAELQDENEHVESAKLILYGRRGERQPISASLTRPRPGNGHKHDASSVPDKLKNKQPRELNGKPNLLSDIQLSHRSATRSHLVTRSMIQTISANLRDYVRDIAIMQSTPKPHASVAPK
jgi:hypothetical protein